MKGNILPHKVILTVVDAKKEINGIIVPNYVKVQPEAIIELTGGDCEVEVGQRVIYDGGGLKIKIDGTEYVLINQNQILYVYG